MTIDEMLDKVSENLNIPQVPQKMSVSDKSGLKPGGAPPESADKKEIIPYAGEKLTLDIAKEIAYLVEKAAEQMGVSVVVAVDNDGARLALLHAMDNSYIASVDAAQKKAYTAAALKMPTHIALKEARGGSLDGFTNGDGILLLGGGYPLEYNGRIYGSVGVSGGTKEQDTTLSKAGADYFRARMNYRMNIN